MPPWSGRGDGCGSRSKAGVRRLIHVSALGADANHSSDDPPQALGEDATLRAFPKATIVRPGLLVGAEDTFFNRFSALPLCR